MVDYRVKLDVYNGPLDLLLYLIRREEVDIYDIPIARITEQYLKYVEYIKAVDPNLAGDFLVMAATLMEIKSRMLLPAPPAEEGEGVAIDPRAELVRQLLEYKAFKDAAGDLAGAAEQQAMKFPRRPARPQADEEPGVDLEDVQIWDLFDAFSKLMEAIGHRPSQREVIYDDTPVELHAADILDRLGREGALTLEGVFEGRETRVELVGLFLAVLELIRKQRIVAKQRANFGAIELRLNPNPPAEAPPGEAAEPEAAEAAEAGAAPPPDRPPQDEQVGEYVSDRPAGADPPADENDDDDRPEAEGPVA
jgi:segregation and condensation protein A